MIILVIIILTVLVNGALALKNKTTHKLKISMQSRDQTARVGLINRQGQTSCDVCQN